MSRQIEVTIAPDGSVKIETSGFQGTSCLDATKAMEAWLGGQLGPRTMKPEARQAAVRTVVTKGGG